MQQVTGEYPALVFSTLGGLYVTRNDSMYTLNVK